MATLTALDGEPGIPDQCAPRHLHAQAVHLEHDTARALGAREAERQRSLAGRRLDRGRLLALAADNARDALRRRRTPPDPGAALQDLQARLKLPNLPARLECLDISTLQGGQAVGALTAFTDGAPDKSRYRRFKIREVAGQDDYAMLREVVQRHYGKAGQDLPDLLVVDGGRGQLNVVIQALTEMGLTKIPVVGLAKATEQGGRPVRDRLFLPGRKNPLLPPANAPGWLLLLRLRDETHRFAITYHKKLRTRQTLYSALDRIPGIGGARKRALLRAFGSNHVHFHAADGSGYRFLAEQACKLDAVNPQVASRIGRCFDRWRKFDAGRQAHARAALEMLRNHAGLSRDLFEIVDRQLG